MSSNEPERRDEDGFEYQGQFYRWRITDTGKDLMLIDRVAGVGIVEFFEMVEDGVDTSRPAVLLTMIATSIRSQHPDWSVERIYRLVMNLSLGDVTILGVDDEQPEQEGMLPPAGSGDEGSRSPSNGSSSSSTPPATTTSPTSSGNPT